MRRGIHTTEFWLSVVTSLAVLLGSVQGSLSPTAAAYSGAAIASLYAVARALTKLGDPALNGNPGQRVETIAKTVTPPTTPGTGFPLTRHRGVSDAVLYAAIFVVILIALALIAWGVTSVS